MGQTSATCVAQKSMQMSEMTIDHTTQPGYLGLDFLPIKITSEKISQQFLANDDKKS